jgi:hypothetical protein
MVKDEFEDQIRGSGLDPNLQRLLAHLTIFAILGCKLEAPTLS